MKTEFKGSPAPWKVEFLGLDEQGEIIEWITCVNGGANIVCLPPEHEYTSREFWDSNSHLISAAPELLEALQKVYEIAKQCDLLETLNSDENNYIENAIKKALNLA